MNKYLSSTFLSLLLMSSMAMAYEGKGNRHEGKFKEKIEQVISQFPDDKAQLVKDTMQGLKSSRKDMREQMKASKEALKASFTAETFDETAFLSYAEKMHELRAQMQALNSKQIAELAKQLTQEERKSLASILPGIGHEKGGWHR